MSHYPQLIGGQPLCPLRPSTADAAERPAKKIKLSDLTTCTEADIASLTKPYLSCIGVVPSNLIEFSGLFIIHFHIWTCGGFPATCFFIKRWKPARRKFSINGSAELITDGSGEALYLVTRSRNQFLQHRELLLGTNCKFPIGIFLGKNHLISKYYFWAPAVSHKV